MKAKAFKVELRYNINENKMFDADELSVYIKNTIQRQLESDIALETFKSTTIDTIVYIIENTGTSITAEVSIVLDTVVHCAVVEAFVAKYLINIPDIDECYIEEDRPRNITVTYYEVTTA